MLRNKRRRQTYRKWISREDRLSIYRRDGFRCVYCDSTFHLQLDHVRPRSKGGSDHRNNLVTACRACNLAKSNRILPGRTKKAKIRNFRKERTGGRLKARYRNNASRKKKYRTSGYNAQAPPTSDTFPWKWVIILLFVLFLVS